MTGAISVKIAPIMFLAILPSTRERRRHMRAVTAIGDAINRRDWNAVKNLLSPDFSMTDQSGNEVCGAEEFLNSIQQFYEVLGDPKLIFDSIDPNREEVLVRGHLENTVSDVRSPTMWRFLFDGPLIRRIEVTRTNNEMTLPRFAAARRATAD
ncbi:hypothetical protein GRI34_06950 [Erythrobacter aquimaris]|uniref:SnoaL-like domain-containing protein n=1 Tax=Qipengyuania aquimaris TaxID=255984 RepID=A0A6I4TJR2_9SPHN|nr:nuclear transport factor 2 family protein [Qipengyuania aquimaris]MXO96155.1 hypothetical protein [Qipengyuania aquimaris]